jgi:hypothetical protein
LLNLVSTASVRSEMQYTPWVLIHFVVVFFSERKEEEHYFCFHDAWCFAWSGVFCGRESDDHCVGEWLYPPSEGWSGSLCLTHKQPGHVSAAVMQFNQATLGYSSALRGGACAMHLLTGVSLV